MISGKHIALAALLLLVAVLGVAAVAADSDEADVHTIRITTTGFTPAERTITAGDRVIWRNETDTPHWPASNIHPTHGRYPQQTDADCLGSAFDACRPLAAGETYRFTFTETGAWDYHDHLRPAWGGTIHVRDDTMRAALTRLLGSARQRIRALFTPSSTFSFPEPDAFREKTFTQQRDALDAASAQDAAAAWTYLKKTFVVDGEVVGNAHELAHIVGNNLYHARGLDGIRTCDQTFAFGCIHGVTEQMLISEGPRIMHSLSTQCRDVYASTDAAMGYTGCIHGVGHGLLSWNGLDVPAALEHCDTLPRNDRPYCYDGVFMEYSFSAPATAFNADAPWELCRGLPERYRYNCARYQATIFRTQLSLTPAEQAAACMQAPTADMREPCVRQMGYRAAQTHHDDVAAIADACNVFSDAPARQLCVSGAAGELAFQGYARWRTHAAALCAALPQTAATACHERTADIAHRYGRAYRKK